MATKAVKRRTLSFPQRWSMSPISIVVLMVLTCVAVASGLVVKTLLDRQEDDLLKQRTADVQLILAQLTAQIESSLQSLATATAATNSDPERFSSAATPLVASGGTVSIVRVDGATTNVVASAGTVSPSGMKINPEGRAAIDRALKDHDLTSTPVYNIAQDNIAQDNGAQDNGAQSKSNGQTQATSRRIGIAFGSAMLPPGEVLFWELPLQAVGSAPATQQSAAFDEVKVVLYADQEQVPAQVVLANVGEGIPFTGKVETRLSPFGADQWLLTVAPTSALLGTLFRSLQWIMFGLGLLLAFAITAVVEVTVRRRDTAVQQVGERSEETASIIDAAQDAFLSFDGEGRIVRWNPRCVEMFGWMPEEVLGRRLGDVILPIDLADQYRQEFAQNRESGWITHYSSRQEFDVVDRSGRRFPVEVAMWVMEQKEGPLFNAFVHDITARRAAALELERAHEQAVEASRLKSEFLANMSHEIRTPMNGVIGMTGLLLRTDLQPEQREYAEIVRTSAESLLSVINDILDFSKIEAGRLELEVVDFDVRTTIEEVADLFADQAQSKGIELLTAIDTDVPVALRGDAGRLRQILVNLVGNALKFTDEGEVVIRVQLMRNSENQTELRFEVVDTGMGISDEDRVRIFESFTQVDTSRTKRHQGTGLGLTIARQLTELMGGELGVESTPGEGSMFWFTAVFGISDAAASSEITQLVGIAGLRVLVVDDNETNAKVLSRTLHDWQMRPEIARNADEAMVALERADAENDPFVLALLDYHMPDIDGMQLAARIHESERLRETRMLLLTSSGDHLDSSEYQNLGVASYLTKPVRHAILRSRIADVVSRSAPAKEEPVNTTEMRVPEPFHVLVVEDNVVNQRVAQRMLEKLGCSVDVVANGNEAVEAVLRQSYALVFMDSQMPELDGYRATAEIRQNEVGRRTPIVAMTAGAMDGDREQALASGMDDYLAKPVQLQQLLAALLKWALRSETAGARKREILDLRVIESLRELDQGEGVHFFKDLMKRFTGTTKSLLGDLHDAARRRDRETMKLIAHTLRGSAATFGAIELTDACTQLEVDLRLDDDEAIDIDIARIAEAMDRTRESLEKELKE